MKTLETIFNFLTSLARIIFPRRQSRQPVTALVPIPTLVLFLMAITPLSLLMEQTEVTLTTIGAILSLSTRATGEPNNVSNP